MRLETPFTEKKIRALKVGDIVEISGDCATFEKDLRAWCDRMHKVCLAVRDQGEGKQTIQIQF